MDQDFEMARRQAPADLRGMISETVLYRETAGRQIVMREVADLVVPLVIGFGAPFLIGLGRAPGTEDRHLSFVAGLTSEHVEILSPGSAYCLQINFTPAGARCFFGMPMHELAGSMVEPSALLGRSFERLRQRLGNETCWERIFDIACDFIRGRIARVVSLQSTAFHAYDLMVATGGRMPVSRLAERSDVSRKHLNTLFGEAFGLSPKTIARIVRFRTAHGLATAATAPDWSDIAAECGYADQAHLIREFRAFSGLTPGELVAGA